MRTITVIATGKSVRTSQIDYVRGAITDVMVINESFLLAPWADYLYAADVDWWKYWSDVVKNNFIGEGYTVSYEASKKSPYPQYIKGENREHSKGGLSLDNAIIYNGGSSGHAALNLCYHLGYNRIVLLGFDMKPGHWFRHLLRPKHLRKESPYDHFNSCITDICKDLVDQGVLVYNCTPNSLLDLPYTPLKEVL